MKHGLCFLPYLLAWTLCAQLPPNVVTNPPDDRAGRELAERLRAMVPAETAEYNGVLKVRTGDGQTKTIPLLCKIIPGEPTWRIIYETAATTDTPAEKLVIIHGSDRPNEYLYARASKPGEPPGDPTALPTNQIAASLAGSDFWLMDLGLDFFHWPTQRLLKTEMRRSRVCQVLESIQPDPPAGGYTRVISWLDKETGGPVIAEAYDSNGKLLKEFSPKSFTKVQGRLELHEMEIRDVKKRSRTRIEFDLNK
jgi:hypothetical protein